MTHWKPWIKSQAVIDSSDIFLLKFYSLKINPEIALFIKKHFDKAISISDVMHMVLLCL